MKTKEKDHSELTNRAEQGDHPVDDVHQLVRYTLRLLQQRTPYERSGTYTSFPKSGLGSTERPIEAPTTVKTERSSSVVRGVHEDGVIQHIGSAQGLKYLPYGLVQGVHHSCM